MKSEGVRGGVERAPWRGPEGGDRAAGDVSGA